MLHMFVCLFCFVFVVILILCKNKSFLLFARGFRKMVYKHWWYSSVQLYKAAFMRAQVKQFQKYIPELTLDDVTR